MANRLDFITAPPIGHRAMLGVIVLQADETLEPEFRHLLDQPGTALYATRIPSGREVTQATLEAMRTALPAATALLPPSLDFDVIGYGCTSGATVIGSDAVSQLVRGATRVRHVTDPLRAVIAACKSLGVNRLGFVTPYVREVSTAMRAALEDQGLDIAAFGSFEQAEESIVARIAPESVLNAILRVGGDPGCDAVFAACTNLRTLEIVAEAEMRLDKPVLSSNHALAWHMLRLAGIEADPAGQSRLMRQSL